MSGLLNIDDGPVGAEWASDAIRVRPSRETSLTTIGSHVDPTSGSQYYTYVKVDDTGTDPLGLCSCSTQGPWTIRTLFIDSPPPSTGPGGMTVTVNSSGFAVLATSGGTQLGQWTHSAHDFWAWSPDGLFFTYVHNDLTVPTSAEWTIQMIATANFTKAPSSPGATGVAVAKGATVFSEGPTLTTSTFGIGGVNLGWNAKSTCLLLIDPPSMSLSLTQKDVEWICPYAGAGTLAGSHTENFVQSDFDVVFSPCGDLSALMPHPLSGVQRALTLIDLRTALTVQPTVDNVPTTVNITGNSPAISTTGTGRKGLTLTQMTPTAIDNAECLRGGGVVVQAQRVFCSTMPPAMPVVPLSPGYSAAAIWPTTHMWVEIPKHTFVRANPAHNEHWCLQVRGDGAAAGDPLAAPPWSGFAIADRHFAQRNISII